jgi:hypothetical protein
MWDPRRLTTLWALTACYRDSFTFYSSHFYNTRYMLRPFNPSWFHHYNGIWWTSQTIKTRTMHFLPASRRFRGMPHVPLNFALLSVCRLNALSGGQIMFPCCHRRCIYRPWTVLHALCVSNNQTQCLVSRYRSALRILCRIWDRMTQLKGDTLWDDLCCHSRTVMHQTRDVTCHVCYN